MTPTALITGASSGIGASFAEAFAAQGHDLILVARSRDKLQALADRINAASGNRVTVIAADLGAPGAAESLKAAVEAKGLAVDVLVNNAGFGMAGAFAKADTVRNSEMVQLNCAAVMELTQAFLPGMLANKRGAIVNVASSAAFQPIPFMGLYAATKAFVLSFSEALAVELAPKGIKVVALCPGPVDTAFFEASGNPSLRGKVPKPLMMSADTVVAQTLAALEAGKPVVVPGLPNKLTSFLPRLLPRRLIATASGKLMGR